MKLSLLAPRLQAKVQLFHSDARFAQDLTFEEWVAIGRPLCSAIRSSQWWVGAWLVCGEDRWLKTSDLDERARAAAKREYENRYRLAREMLGLEDQTLHNIATVFRKVPDSRRRDELSWGHHESVAALPAAEQKKWLALAVAKEWTRGELRRALRTAGKTVQEEPAIEIGFGPERPSSELLRGFRGEIARLGPIASWKPELRQSWKRLLKPVFEFYLQL